MMYDDGTVPRPHVLKARSQGADAHQAHYFRRMLTVEREALRTELAKHTARLTDAQAVENPRLMRQERGVIHKLEAKQYQVAAMLYAIETRFDVAKEY
jgi:hypothetical protein